jgi:hypothetical protein
MAAPMRYLLTFYGTHARALRVAISTRHGRHTLIPQVSLRRHSSARTPSAWSSLRMGTPQVSIRLTTCARSPSTDTRCVFAFSSFEGIVGSGVLPLRVCKSLSSMNSKDAESLTLTKVHLVKSPAHTCRYGRVMWPYIRGAAGNLSTTEAGGGCECRQGLSVRHGSAGRSRVSEDRRCRWWSLRPVSVLLEP